MRKSKTKRSRMRATDKATDIIRVPGPLVTDDLVTASFRFVLSSNITATAITRGALLNLLAFATSTTNVDRLIQAIRIRRVHIWSAPATTGSVSTSSFQWTGAYSRPSYKISTSMGTSGISHQTEKPPAKSLAADWSIAGSSENDVLFTVALNDGDVLQLDVVYQLQNGAGGEFTAVGITTSGVIAGYLYAVSLDHAVTAKCVPVGRLSVTGL